MIAVLGARAGGPAAFSGGVSGLIADGWYRHDTEKIKETLVGGHLRAAHRFPAAAGVRWGACLP
jgi:hypothetical protein